MSRLVILVLVVIIVVSTFIYYIAGNTKASLNNRNSQITELLNKI